MQTGLAVRAAASSSRPESTADSCRDVREGAEIIDQTIGVLRAGTASRALSHAGSPCTSAANTGPWHREPHVALGAVAGGFSSTPPTHEPSSSSCLAAAHRESGVVGQASEDELSVAPLHRAGPGRCGLCADLGGGFALRPKPSDGGMIVPRWWWSTCSAGGPRRACPPRPSRLPQSGFVASQGDTRASSARPATPPIALLHGRGLNLAETFPLPVTSSPTFLGEHRPPSIRDIANDVPIGGEAMGDGAEPRPSRERWLSATPLRRLASRRGRGPGRPSDPRLGTDDTTTRHNDRDETPPRHPPEYAREAHAEMDGLRRGFSPPGSRSGRAEARSSAWGSSLSVIPVGPIIHPRRRTANRALQVRASLPRRGGARHPRAASARGRGQLHRPVRPRHRRGIGSRWTTSRALLRPCRRAGLDPRSAPGPSSKPPVICSREPNARDGLHDIEQITAGPRRPPAGGAERGLV